jgi:RNA-directed DNA polymerase
MQESSSLSLGDICSRLGLLPDAVLQVSRDSRKYYSKFNRRKRTGGWREISASKGQLKWMQRTLLDGVLAQFEMPPHVHGCVKGRSALSNAQTHVDRDVVINVDLADFFGHVSLLMVMRLLVHYFAFQEDAAEVFAELTVTDGVLPQGAPTSPVLANLAALKLDSALMDLCKEHAKDGDFRYSRYVDDITISGGTELVELLPKIYHIIESNGFTPSVQKTKILRRHARQAVTGIVVNKRASVPKTLLRKLRQHIYYCHRWGIKEHCENLGLTPEQFLKTIRGSIGYIGRANPELAMEFAIALTEANQALDETREDRNLKLLKQMIDEDVIAAFRYIEDEVVAAPASLTVDPEGVLLVRAFQLQPDQGWKYFSLSEIRRLNSSATKPAP